MRVLVLAALLVGCAAGPDDGGEPPFELRVGFDRHDGTVVVNGEPFTGDPFTERLVFMADSYEDARKNLVLDVTVTTASGTITQQLRPGYCITSPHVGLASIGTVTLESLGYEVLEYPSPDLQVSSFTCEGTLGGAAGGP
jgi:hypothetical protein